MRDETASLHRQQELYRSAHRYRDTLALIDALIDWENVCSGRLSNAEIVSRRPA